MKPSPPVTNIDFINRCLGRITQQPTSTYNMLIIGKFD